MKPLSERFSIRLFVAVLLILVSFGMLWIIVHEVIVEKEKDIDRAITDALNAHINHNLNRFMEGISFLASRYFLMAGYIILISCYLFYYRKRIVAASVAIIGIVGFLLVTVLKNVFQRNRPLHPLMERLPNYSFPSGHATSGFIFYGLLIYLAWQGKFSTLYKCILSFFLLSVSLLIGISRIYLNMHYPSDVLAGFCLGYAWLMTSILLLRWLQMPATDGIKKL